MLASVIVWALPTFLSMTSGGCKAVQVLSLNPRHLDQSLHLIWHLCSHIHRGLVQHRHR